MATGQRYAVGVTLVPLSSPRQSAEPEPWREPEPLPELLPRERSAAENARLLQQITAAEAILAGLRVQAVAQLAAARPDTSDRRFGRDADQTPGPDRPAGVSEFLADELALVLNASRAAATSLIDQCTALTEKLPATLAALDAGRLDWPRARAIAGELGWKARDVAPSVVAAVEAAVLPSAPELSITRLKAAVRRELAARDAAASDQRRADAERSCDVTVRPVGDGISELVTRMPHELAAACKRRVDEEATAAATTDGEVRPLGVLRAGVVADSILQPWDPDRPSVTADLTVDVPLAALTADRFLAEGSPLPAVFAPPGATAAPTASVDGEPITTAHVRRLLADLDAIGLRPPAGGSLRFAFTDDDGALLAVAADTELRAVARRGCPDHPDGICGCAVLGVPAAVDRYRPSAPQVRYLRTRDRTCRHPGCARRAARADCDHVVPHARGGPTSCENLCCLCRRHHRLKTHAPRFRHVMAADGTLTVTTPSGVTRTSRTDRKRRAAADRARAPGTGPPGLPLTTFRVLPARPPAPEDDPPPF
ncbi:HNH endonuclease signature motif containing protein [Blastococcus sp. TF02A-26]|uniref:HNH endonuclease signature motif containing protein n=1 Tax=Blastococcus sp. TF02A-26 TaxID=2250577 RepID=UPI000DEB850B|nr:HNH endonuclease signature motif containing protein [Blastococcus sp. TF02A-26]RBY83375.1 HNH endonuclease [Blastococcus sp. TF02A-26]